MTAFTPTLQIYIGGAVYVDNVDVNSISITGGRFTTGYQPDPMLCTIDLIPESGYLAYDLNDSLEIMMLDPTTSNYVTIFYGYISDINFNFALYGNGVGQRRYTLTAQDPTSLLAFQSFYPSTPSFSQDDAGMQLALALSYSNLSSISAIGGTPWTTYPTTTPTIDSSPTATYQLDAISPDQWDNIGDFVKETADQVNGCFYYKPQDGKIWFDGVTRRSGRTAFTLTDNEIRPDINLTRSIGMIINRAKVSRSGADKYASSTNSQTQYGRRQYQRDTRLHLAADAQTKATNIVSAFAAVSGSAQAKVWRPSTISVDLHNPNITDAKRSSLINTYCGKPVNLSNIPDPEGTSYPGVMSLNCYIEGWTWSFGMSTATISMQLSLISDVPQ